MSFEDFAVLLQVGWPFLCILLGLLIGRRIEAKHYASIRKREPLLQHVLVSSTRKPPASFTTPCEVQMLSASVVVSADAFKSFIASIRNFFGGNMSSYETLLDRARREALLRVKEQAQQLGGDLVIGLRYYSNSINDSFIPSVEVMAVGTMLRPQTIAQPHTQTNS